MENELFFVGIRDPTEIRKELLTSSKNIIDSLRRYERYNSLREQKTTFIVELKRTFDELLVLNKKLRGSMPRTPMKTPSIVRDSKLTDKKPAKKAPADALEAELSRIEERLGSLR